jgi:hypothetical protein
VSRKAKQINKLAETTDQFKDTTMRTIKMYCLIHNKVHEDVIWYAAKVAREVNGKFLKKKGYVCGRSKYDSLLRKTP